MNGTEAVTKKLFTTTLTWLSICAVVLALVSAADAKRKQNEPEVDEANWRNQLGKSTLVDHSKIDTSRLVWPQPPAIPRVRFLREVQRELRPTDTPSGAPAPPQKKKQSWMDRMAGVETTDTGAVKIQRDHWLGKPYGIGVDSKGQVYVADTFVSAVFIFNLEEKTTKLLRNGIEAHWDTITGLTVDDADRVFVVDSSKHRVAVFGSDLKLEAYFGDDQLKTPTGVAVDPENRLIYVVDTDKQQVAVFDADSFKYLRAIGRPMKDVGDDAPGALSKPTNVVVDANALVYISDTLNNRIQVFDADGNFVRMWGKSGDAAGYFARPKGLSVDGDGHIWVSDSFLNYVQIFDQEGHLLGYLGGGGTYPGQFSVPTGVCVDQKSNRVFVVDQFPGRMQVFRYVTDQEAKALKQEQEMKKSGGAAAQAAPTADAKVQPQKGRVQ
jgi:DNA-binding beta-propeller fold protein YncE